MTKDETLKLALEAFGEIEWSNDSQWQSDRAAYAMLAIKEALAQPEQEPMVWMNDTGTHIDLNVSGRGTPLYTTPPQRTWVGLTDEDDIDWEDGGNLKDLVKAIEAKLKEKNT